MKQSRLIAAAGISAFAFLSMTSVLGAQIYRMSGAVLTSIGERPIANAEVIFPALNLTVRSDSTGRYALGQIPRGDHQVTVRHVGYQPVVANLRFNDSDFSDADFLLEAVPVTLATVDVRADIVKRWAPQLTEFNERRKFGFGKFISIETIDKNSHLSLPSLLHNYLASVRVQDIRGAKVPVSVRALAPCPVQVIVDRLIMFNGEEVFYDLSVVPVDRIIGIEYYTNLMTPSEFLSRPKGPNGGSRCGTLILWFKH